MRNLLGYIRERRELMYVDICLYFFYIKILLYLIEIFGASNILSHQFLNIYLIKEKKYLNYIQI